MNYLSKMFSNDLFNDERFNKYILSALFGVGALILIRKLVSLFDSFRYNFPIEIELTGEEEDLENFLINLQKNYPHECTLKLKKSWFQFRSERIVVLNSAEAVKKFSKSNAESNAITNRPKNFLLKFISKNYLGSFFRMNNEKLTEIRKSSLAGLHKLTINNVAFEKKLNNEIKDFINFINSKVNSSGFCLENAAAHLQQISTNILLIIGLDVRFPYELETNTAVKNQIKNMSEILTAMNLIKMTQFKCKHKYLDKKTFGYVEERVNSINNFLSSAAVGYKTTNFDSTKAVRTFADFVFGKQIELKNLKPEDNYSTDDILVQFFTLFMAGAGTTGFSLAWAFHFLSTNLNVQEKIFKEIISICGSSEFLIVDHSQHSKMHYTRATLNEIIRMASTVYLVPRATIQKSNIESYVLPKNTVVLVNAFGIHRNEKFWNKALSFKPERWINEDGTCKDINSEFFVAFGFMGRSCLGEQLARKILFLTIINLVRSFKIENSMKSVSSKLGIMRCPSNYNLKFVKRN